MAIEFRCACGAPCSADESRAGQLFHCEACGADIPVPAPEETGKQAGLEALRQELGQGGVADIASEIKAAGGTGVEARPHVDLGALKHEMEAGLSDEEAAKRGAAREAFQAQLGHREGAAELIAQLTGRTAGPAPPPEAGAPPGAAPGAPAMPGAPAVPGAPARAAAQALKEAKAAGLPRPPTGAARAAHHFRFKRAMWMPTLIIAFVCAAAGAWCFVPRAHVRDPVIDAKIPEIVADARGDLWAIPRGTAAVARDDGTMGYKGADGQEGPARKIVKDQADRFWAVPADKKPQLSKGGRMMYLDDSGYEMLAEPADEWMDVHKRVEDVRRYKGVREQGYFQYGIALAAVAAVLAALGLWMWVDVRRVGLEVPVAEEIPPPQLAPPAAAPAPPAPGDAPPAETGPAAGAETPKPQS